MPRPSLRVLVTGTSGYLGGLVAAHLEARGHTVTRLPDREQLSRVEVALPPAPLDVAIHAAFAVDFRPSDTPRRGPDPVDLTRRLLAALRERGAPRVLFLGAAGALGVSEAPRARSEQDLGTTDPPFVDYRATHYIQDKLACEGLLTASGLEHTVLYLTTVYGPGMARGVRDGLLPPRRLPLGVRPCPPGGTSFLDERDFLEGVDLALEGPAVRAVLSSGNADYATLFAAAAAAVGAPPPRVALLPPRLRDALIHAERLAPRANLAVIRSAFGYKYYSAERARKLLGWTARRTLGDALRRALGP